MATSDEILALRSGDAAAREAYLAGVFEAHHARLRRMVELRMDRHLKARLGASDVLQEAFLDATKRFDAYVDQPDMPLYLWLRFLTAQRMARLWRYHVGTQKRDARRQLPSAHPLLPAATSLVLVEHMESTGTSPMNALVRDELRDRLLLTLDEMKPEDREVLVLRHFEELSNSETAAELGISTDAASKRYLRALDRLGSALGEAGPP